MARRLIASVLVCVLALLASSLASAAIVEHTFNVKDVNVTRLCKTQLITAVNGQYPGPTITAREGDTLVVHVINQSPYNLTIHWHGVFQLLSAWADGPSYVTQCPILPGKNYTYRFNVTGQEGTLWWHAHVSWLRATVHGALIIHPKASLPFPFLKPYQEVPIILGEWWNGNVVDIENAGLATGGAPNSSNAYTINGMPGNLYNCSQNQTFKLKVVKGKTYMLRIINAALNNQLFFKIANHKMTVVAVDATYTTPYITDVVLTGPGQTTDVLLNANQAVGSYYMAANPYASAAIPFPNTTTRGVIEYVGYTSSSGAAPLMPNLTNPQDTATAHKFSSNLTALVGARHWVPVPLKVDEHMFVTVGVNLDKCAESMTCQGPLQNRLSASMNNESFVLPESRSMLEAFFSKNASGIYTTDFPDTPPVEFDYTNSNISLDLDLIFANKSTKVKKLKFNSTVEIVLQNTAFLSVENHPIHLHGFNFHVLAQGFGNYNATNDAKKFNLINPQIRNTIGVPVGGWAVIRFTADNPGIWFMHCHLDVHLPWGLGMAFEVENGPTPSSTLPPPPLDLPQC